MLERYFTLEDPSRLEPAERELYVETLLDSKLLLRGFVDRIDIAPDGAIRVVDYKTGRSPGEMFEAKALFQMKFYALVIWRTRGVVPAMLQLIYLGNGEILRYVPDEARPAGDRAQGRGDLAGHPARRGVRRLAAQPRPALLWCAHQSVCPACGGTPPPLPGPDASRVEPSLNRPPACGLVQTAAGALQLRFGPNRRLGVGQSVALGPERGLGAVGDPDPGEGRGQVGLDGALADVEPAGDLLVGQALADQPEHFRLAAGQLDLRASPRGCRAGARRLGVDRGLPRLTARMPWSTSSGSASLSR